MSTNFDECPEAAPIQCGFLQLEHRGSGSSLKQQVGLDNLELSLGMQAARVAICDSHPSHFESVGWVCIISDVGYGWRRSQKHAEIDSQIST